MQNDFVRRRAPMEVPDARRVVPANQRLLAGFRRAGLPVVFTRYIACGDYAHLAGRLPWIRLLDPPVCACVPGHFRQYADRSSALDCADVIDELAPLPGEAVVDKPFFSAFHRADLHERLHAVGADGLLVTGTLTEMCVEDTARHAVHWGYPTVMVSDAVASNDAEAHAAALRSFARNYGWALGTDAALAMIQRRPGTAVAGPDALRVGLDFA